MPSLSYYSQSGLYNHFLRGATFSKPSTIAVALTTNVPRENDTGATIAELPNANGYSRVTNASGDAYWRHFIPGSGDNLTEISFGPFTADVGMVSGVVLLDSATHGAGNNLMQGALPVPRDIRSGDVYRFAVGALDVFFD